MVSGLAIGEHVGEDALADCGAGFIFISTTVVATRAGEQAIGTLKTGEQVWAYNPTTKKMELQPILHVWISHDNDLVDLTLTHTIKQGKTTKSVSEVIHTNKKHPFLTVEKGFLPVGQITLGLHIVEANGQTGIVSGWRVVPGGKTMYNLEVALDHTFVVGMGMWVVHNCGNEAYQFADDLISKVQPNNWNHILNNTEHAAGHDWSRVGVNSLEDLKGVLRDTIAENHQDILSSVSPNTFVDFSKDYGGTKVFARISKYGVYRLTTAFLK